MAIYFNRNLGVNFTRTQKAKEAEVKQEAKETPKTPEKSDLAKGRADNLVPIKDVLKLMEAQAKVNNPEPTGRRNARESLKESTNRDFEGDNFGEPIGGSRPDLIGRGGGGGTYVPFTTVDKPTINTGGIYSEFDEETGDEITYFSDGSVEVYHEDGTKTTYGPNDPNKPGGSPFDKNTNTGTSSTQSGGNAGNNAKPTITPNDGR